VLAHRERLTPKPTQRDLAEQRMRDWSEHGKPLGPLPTPGVYARHNAVDTPALLPDGSTAPTSVSRALKIRGDVRDRVDRSLVARRSADSERQDDRQDADRRTTSDLSTPGAEDGDE
jgi:NADH-quinone oxidoreductase subunit J